MDSKIKLDLISDVVCPWCVISYKRLEKAIKDLDAQDRIDIEWHPFELNPNMPEEGENLRTHLAKKYGTTHEDSVRARENLTNLGKEVGFSFDYFDEMKMVNTKKAHLLLQYAKPFEKQTEVKMALFTAFFGQRKDISDTGILREIAESVGFDVDEAMGYLTDKEAVDSLNDKQEYWRNLGIRSVPTVVFNMAGSTTGAQPAEVYRQVLTDLLAEQG